MVGSRWVKTAEKTRAQSPKSNLGKRGGPLKTTPNKKIKDILLKFVFYNNCGFPECSSDEVSRETSPASDESLQESNHFRLNSEGHTQLVPFDNMSSYLII